MRPAASEAGACQCGLELVVGEHPLRCCALVRQGGTPPAPVFVRVLMKGNFGGWWLLEQEDDDENLLKGWLVVIDKAGCFYLRLCTSGWQQQQGSGAECWLTEKQLDTSGKKRIVAGCIAL
uniref:Uncharacterized protein n=1 Tax=Ditylenchus dipsaci TaxID=166011 RepID=A0A915ERE5_9BILA